MVVGAGRGPLVRAALNASVNAKQRIKVYAVEKNPNAVLTLVPSNFVFMQYAEKSLDKINFISTLVCKLYNKKCGETSLLS